MLQNSADLIIQNIEEAKQQWNYTEALNIALQWLNQHINDYRLYEELADIYLHNDNIEKAEEVLKYARELHPDSGTGLFLQGHLYAEKWDFEKSIHIMEQVNAIMPNNSEILRIIGWNHIMLGSMEKWIALLRRAHTLNPEDETIIHNLNIAHFLSENQNEKSI